MLHKKLIKEHFEIFYNVLKCSIFIFPFYMNTNRKHDDAKAQNPALQ